MEQELRRKHLAEFAHDFEAGLVGVEHHRQEDAGDADGGAFLAESRERFHEEGDAAHGEGFGLLGDDDPVGTAHDGFGHAGHAGGGVEDDAVITEEVNLAEEVAQFFGGVFEIGAAHELIGTAAREDAELGQAGGDDEASGFAALGHEVVEAAFFAGVFGEGESDAALRVGVDQKSVPAAAREGVAEIDADGGFTDSSLLTGGGEYDHGRRLYQFR